MYSQSHLISEKFEIQSHRKFTREDSSIRLKLLLRRLEVCYEKKGDSRMDWVNCNTCCRQPGDEPNCQFKLTSCGHFFCEICLAQEPNQVRCSSHHIGAGFVKINTESCPKLNITEKNQYSQRDRERSQRSLDFENSQKLEVELQRPVVERFNDETQLFQEGTTPGNKLRGKGERRAHQEYIIQPCRVLKTSNPKGNGSTSRWTRSKYPEDSHSTTHEPCSQTSPTVSLQSRQSSKLSEERVT
ncbi:unnamed protein product, partial [Meganyctiphanes norvegica]